MNAMFIVEILKAVFRELLAFKKWVVVLFVLISFSILILGVRWPERYETGTTLYVDASNIIKPLLEGRAEVTTVDRSKEAGELIYTRKILSKVAESSGLLKAGEAGTKANAVINRLRNNIAIENQGNDAFLVTYSDVDQDKSFNILNTVVNAFILETSDKKRQESRNAFEFIDQQVSTYKRQLVEAEEKLKNFQSSNLDGTQASVTSRIQSLRADIEEIKLSVEETAAQAVSLRQQLKNEGRYQSARTELDGLLERQASLNRTLESLRLSYQESYPDIVEIKDQIAALQLVIDAAKEEGGVSGFSSSASVENPLYEELRKNLANMELELSRQKNRQQSMEKILEGEYARAKRVAAREAELSELLRDNDVTRDIYEEMLGRKEKARLSMTLDVEGQGVTYKIQEPAVYPLDPTGLRFIHFVLVAPLLGLLLPVGLIVAYVILDPRVRSPSMLVQQLPEDVELIGVIPHINSPIAQRVIKRDIVMLGCVLLVALSAYLAIVVAVFRGVI